MSGTDLHEVQFVWPHTEPSTVIVTGTFDQWAGLTPLSRTSSGFEGAIKIPWNQKIKYKFIVDGEWFVHDNQPTETDPGGFINNVYTAPPKPVDPTSESLAQSATIVQVVEALVKDEGPIANGHTNGHAGIPGIGDGKAAGEFAVTAPAVQAVEPADSSESNGARIIPTSSIEYQPSDSFPTGYPQLIADLASTIVARDGTSSALGYVASGLGAVMHSVVGVDPINIQKIAIPTPQPSDGFALPGGQESVPNSADLSPEFPHTQESLPSPIAPIVPIMIVPVNAAENNIPPSPPALPLEVTPPAEMLSEATTAAADNLAVEVQETSTHVPIVVAADPDISAANAEEKAPVPVISEARVEEVDPISKLAAEHSLAIEPLAYAPEQVVTAPELAATPKEKGVLPVSEHDVPAVDDTVSEASTGEDISLVKQTEEPSPPEFTPVSTVHETEPVEPLAPEPTIFEGSAAAGETSTLEPTPVHTVEEQNVLDSTSALEELAAGEETKDPSAPEPAPELVSKVPAAEVMVEEPSAPEPATDTVDAKAKAVPELIPTAEHITSTAGPSESDPVNAKQADTPINDGLIQEKRHETPAAELTHYAEPPSTDFVPEMKEVPTAFVVKEVVIDQVSAPAAESLPTVFNLDKVTPSLPNKVAEEPVLTGESQVVHERKAEEIIQAMPELKEEELVGISADLVAPTSIAPKGYSAAAEAENESTKSGDTTLEPITLARSQQKFPSTAESSSSRHVSSSSSKINSVRKKKTSIFGKLKHIFHHDKQEKN